MPTDSSSLRKRSSSVPLEPFTHRKLVGPSSALSNTRFYNASIEFNCSSKNQAGFVKFKCFQPRRHLAPAPEEVAHVSLEIVQRSQCKKRGTRARRASNKPGVHTCVSRSSCSMIHLLSVASVGLKVSLDATSAENGCLFFSVRSAVFFF